MSDSCSDLASKSWKAEQLLWRSWANEHIVYNVSSGNTHTISAVAAKVLKLLEESPQTGDQITQYLASDSGLDSDDELAAHVARLVADLDELGLVLSIS